MLAVPASNEKRRRGKSACAAAAFQRIRVLEPGADPIVTSSLRFPTPRIDRRSLLAGTCALAVTSIVGDPRAFAQSTAQSRAEAALAAPEPLTPSRQFEEAFFELVGNATPVEKGLALELPEEAENGNIVPYKISAESPMTAEDHVKEIHLLSTRNPQAKVAAFHFSLLSGEAAVSGRMRLAKTQEVIAVAVTSANTFLIGRRVIHVGIGGCGEG